MENNTNFDRSEYTNSEVLDWLEEAKAVDFDKFEIAENKLKFFETLKKMIQTIKKGYITDPNKGFYFIQYQCFENETDDYVSICKVNEKEDDSENPLITVHTFKRNVWLLLCYFSLTFPDSVWTTEFQSPLMYYYIKDKKKHSGGMVCLSSWFKLQAFKIPEVFIMT